MFVMIVLLVFSGVTAALVPVDREPRESDTTRTTTTTEPERPDGRLLSRTLRAAAKRPQVVRVRVGDALTLGVYSRQPDQVEIEGLGELEDVDRYAPAIFELAPYEPAVYPVRLLETGRTIGRIEVAPAKPPRREGGERGNREAGERDRGRG